MSTSVSFNGSSYTIPATGEDDWGGVTKVDGFLVSVAANALSKAGGTFTLTSEVDFGGTAGLKSSYLKSRGSNTSTSGVIRLANTESVSWRNAGNSADLALAVDASNNLTFNSAVLFPATVGAANTVLVSDGTNASWATLVNANVNASAAIALSKLAALGTSKALASDGSGVISVSTVTTTELQRLSGITSTAVGISDTQTLTNKTITSFTGGSASTITTPSATGTLATLTGTEILTNKDIDGATAANASRITLPKASLASLQALTRKTATLWYASDVNKLYSDDGTSLNQVGSGAGGSINYVLNPDSETGTTGWAAYADAAAATPVDGTGGSPTTTITRTTSSPLRGTGSFLITKDAANRQGEGVSYAFTIDAADKAKVLNVSFDYSIASGTFVSGDSSDVRVYLVQDPTGTPVVIQPAPYTIQGGSGNNFKFTGTFQTSSSITSYAVCLHVATTSASAWTLKFDNVVVGPQIQLYGAPASDWAAFTPTGSWSANTTYTGFYRRIGDSAEVMVRVATSGAPTSAALTINLPSGLVIDTTKLASSTNPQTLGEVYCHDSGVASYPGVINYSSTTAIAATYLDASANIQSVSQSAPFTFGASDSVNIKLIVPIAGWSSTVLMSNDTDTRIVAALITGDPASATSGNPIIVPTAGYDSHAAYNASSGRYTCPVSGIYKMYGALQSASSATTLTIYKNAVSTSLAGNLDSNGEATFSSAVSCIAGDIIDLRPGGTVDATSMTLNIERLSGPSAIAASEQVAMRATSSTTSVSSNVETTVVFPTVTFDTHSAYNSSTGIWTAPRSGFAKVRVTLDGPGIAATKNKNYIARVYKNASLYSQFAIFTQATDTYPIGVNGSDIAKVVAGDTITVKLFQDTGSTVVLGGSTSEQIFSVEMN